MELLFIISVGIRFVIGLFMGIFGRVFIKSWRNWIEKRFSKAIITSDFRVSLTMAEQPRLQLIFQIHNGTVSAINLNEIVVNLHSADAYIAGIAGSISDISLVTIPSAIVAKGKEVDVTISIMPSFEFWLLPRKTLFSLRKSSILISSIWGNIAKPLEPDNIRDNIVEFEEQIDEYIAKIGRILSTQLT